MFRRSTPDANQPPEAVLSPHPRRWGLYGPYIALAIAVLLWSAAWLAARSEVLRHMDSAIAKSESVGYHFSWKHRTVDGYPFRLDLVLTDFKGRSPGGWGLESRRLEAEAYLHAPDHWVFGAPEGLSLVRPLGGPVEITGSTIHASLHGMSVQPPSFSFEGLNLRFAPAEGARPFALSGADKVELHLRPGPDHQGAVLFRLTQGKASLPGLLGKIAGNQPVNLELEAILSKADSLKGPGWREAARAWAVAGGRASVRSALATAGAAMIKARSGDLSLSPDGILSGQLDVALSKAPETLDLLSTQGQIPREAASAAAAQASPASLALLSFHDGATYLGSFAIGPAPRLF